MNLKVTLNLCIKIYFNIQINDLKTIWNFFNAVMVKGDSNHNPLAKRFESIYKRLLIQSDNFILHSFIWEEQALLL